LPPVLNKVKPPNKGETCRANLSDLKFSSDVVLTSLVTSLAMIGLDKSLTCQFQESKDPINNLDSKIEELQSKVNELLANNEGNSAGADEGPRSLICACLTLRSAQKINPLEGRGNYRV
jgi:hypothetical protein